MGFEEAVKGVASSSDHVDQLLEEYLRVINDKDDQLQGLLKQLELLKAAAGVKEAENVTRLKQLMERLRRKSQRLKETKAQSARDEETIKHLSFHSEALKKELDQCQAVAGERAALASRADEKIQQLERELSEARSSLVELRMLQAERAEVGTSPPSWDGNEETAEVTNLRRQLETAVQTAEERRLHEQQLKSRIAEMISPDQHTNEMAALESKLSHENTQRQQEVEQLQKEVVRAEARQRAMQQEMRKAHEDVEELTASLHAATKALDGTKHELATSHLTSQQMEKELRAEVLRSQRAHQGCTERVAELERALGRCQESVQRTTAELQALQLQHERVKVTAEKADSGAHAQLQVAEVQLRQARDEVGRMRLLLEEKERAIKDGVHALSRAHEEAARTQTELREKMTAAAATAASRATECEHLQQELSHTRCELADTRRQSAADERTLTARLEDIQVAVQRLQVQLRDKDEQVRSGDLAHNREMDKLRYDHAVAMQEASRRHEGEVRDIRGRLQTTCAELCEKAGGSKGLEKELLHAVEGRQELRSEMGRLQSIIEAKEAALQSLRRDLEKQHFESVQLAQRLGAHERDETALRQRVDAAERALADSEAAKTRAQETVVTLKQAAAASAASTAAVEAQLSEKSNLAAALRYELTDCKSTKQTALKELMQEQAHREKLALALSSAEERMSCSEQRIRTAMHEQQRLQRAVEESDAEVRRLRSVGEQHEAECLRLTRHAEEVEALARRTAEELRTTIETHESSIQRLRDEQATILPHLNEEMGKSLVLQEKLQRLQETSRMRAEEAQERIRVLEEQATVHATEMINTLRSAKERAERLLRESESRVVTLTKTLEERDMKYRHRKEELRKALLQVEDVKTSTAAARQKAEEEMAAASSIREKYKKEKGKMESLLKQMEERVQESYHHEESSQQREVNFSGQLERSEEARRRAQETLDTRIRDVKSHYESILRQREEAFHDASSEGLAAAKLAITLQAQLHDAQRKVATADGRYRELQRTVLASRTLALEEYVEEVVGMKRGCSALLLSLHNSSVSRALSAIEGGWVAIQKTSLTYSEGTKEAERLLSRMQTKHQGEMQALSEVHQRAQEATAAEHRETVGRLQADVAAAVQRLHAQTEEMRQALQARDQHLRDVEASLASTSASLQEERERSALLRAKVAEVDALRSTTLQKAQEEIGHLQGGHEKLRRQLDDRAVEKQHDEDELRELRAEVAALKRALSEMERRMKQESNRAAEEHDRSASLVAVSEAAEQRCSELNKQLHFMRGQLETARVSHERVISEHQATQRELERQAQRVHELTKEVRALRHQEANVLGELHVRKTEASALHERCANMESLKNISEAALAQVRKRERDLMEKVEELRNAQQLMQLCFDKQQEQLEVGRRLRQQDALQLTEYPS